MLKSLKIKRFKAISDQAIELTDLSNITILVGGNNSGKTAILEALWLVGELIFKINDDYTSNFNELFSHGINIDSGAVLGKVKTILPNTERLNDLINSKGHDFEIEFEFFLSDNFHNKLNSIFPVLGDKERKRLFWSQFGKAPILKINYFFDFTRFRCRISSVYFGNVNVLNSGNVGRLFNVERFVQTDYKDRVYDSGNGHQFYRILYEEMVTQLRGMSVYYIPSKRKILELISSTDNNPSQKGENLKNVLFKLYHGADAERQEYNRILDTFKTITGKEIREIPFLNRSSNLVDVVFKEVNNIDVSIDNSGYGYYQLLSLIFNIYQSRSNLVLLDEPEISLHPQAQIKFYESIKRLSKSENIQFLITTHSPYFLDLNEVDKIAKISKRDSGCQVHKLNNLDVIKVIKEKRDGIFHFRNRELFFMNRVVLVEGLNDLDKFAQILDEQVFDNFAKELLYYVQGGGVQNINVYKQFCEDLNIEVRFLTDFDVLNMKKEWKDIFISILKSLKETDSVVLDFLKLIDADDKSKIKEFWRVNWKIIWSKSEVRDYVIGFERQKVYIMPFMDVRGMNADRDLMPEVINVLQRINASFK